MLISMPSSSCIKQVGPWHTAAYIKVREDGYLMDDIRTLARFGQGIATAATFSRPYTVNLMEYTEASIHVDTATALYKEPVSIESPMPRPGAPPPPRNA
jgi:hypothetical protein